MEKLIKGVQRFQAEQFAAKKELFAQLAEGQQPSTLLITCSDSRIDPHLLTQSEPGELFVLRNAGNIVPEYGAFDGGEAATIEYAVNFLRVKEIVVCGHSRCGAMGGLLNPDALSSFPAVRAWLKHAEGVESRVAEKYGGLDDAGRLAAAVEQNVLLQIEHLQSHPAVAAAVQEGKLALEGWVYRFETGEVFRFDAGTDRFALLT